MAKPTGGSNREGNVGEEQEETDSSGSKPQGDNKAIESEYIQPSLMDPKSQWVEGNKSESTQHHFPSDTHFERRNRIHIDENISFEKYSGLTSKSNRPGTATDTVEKEWQQHWAMRSNEAEYNTKIINDDPCMEANYRDGAYSISGDTDMHPMELFSQPSTIRSDSHGSTTSNPHAYDPSGIDARGQAQDNSRDSVQSEAHKAAECPILRGYNGEVDSGVLARIQHTSHVNIESASDAASPNMARNEKRLDSMSGTGAGTHGCTFTRLNDSDNKCLAQSSDQSGTPSARDGASLQHRGLKEQTAGNMEAHKSGPGYTLGNIDSVRQRCQEILEKHNQIKESLYRDHYNTVATGDSFENSNSSEEEEDEEDGMIVKTLKKDTDSESENESLNTSFYGEREYALSEPLGEDSSDSEYCIIFKRVLEAITEEDTDDLDTTGDTDAEVHDIPADDESGGVSDNQGETVAIGNQGRPFSNGEINSRSSSSSSSASSGDSQKQRPRGNMNNGLHDRQLAQNDGRVLALIDENKRNVTHERSSSVEGYGNCPPGVSVGAESCSKGTIYRLGGDHALLLRQRHDTISRQMNIHMDKSGPMNEPLGKEESEVDEEVGAPGNEEGGAPNDPSLQGDIYTTISSTTIPSGSNTINQGTVPQGSFDLSDTDLASDTNSIDVAVDFDPEKIKEAEKLRCYGGWVNTHRPVTIGPYHDRQSEFARRSYINVHSPGDYSPRTAEPEEEEPDTPVVSEYKCGLEAALAALEEGVAQASVRHEDITQAPTVNTDGETDGSSSTECLNEQPDSPSKIHLFSDQTAPSVIGFTSSKTAGKVQCRINVTSVPSSVEGDCDSSRSSSTVSLQHKEYTSLPHEPTDIRLSEHSLQPQQKPPLGEKTTDTASPVLHQAKSLREAALDAVNAPPHDDYYLQSQYYDCKPSVSSNNQQELEQRPQLQALSSSPAPSFARSSETDTVTDLEFDSAEESSLSSRYRTPEAGSGAESFNEEQWRNIRKEEALVSVPGGYSGRHGDGYVLEHWEETGNSSGSFVVDLKVDVHHLGPDKDSEEQEDETDEDRSYGREQGTESEEERNTVFPSQENPSDGQGSEIEKPGNELDETESETEEVWCGTEEPGVNESGWQKGAEESEVETGEDESEIDVEQNLNHSDEKEENDYLIQQRLQKKDEPDGINESLTGESRWETGKFEIKTEEPPEITFRCQSRLITVKASTSTTERPLHLGIISCKSTQKNKNESASLNYDGHDLSGSNVERRSSGGTNEYGNSTENIQAESEVTMDAKSKVYQELELLQDFKESEEQGRHLEANQGQADKREAENQQSNSIGSSTDQPLDSRSQEIGVVSAEMEIESSQSSATKWGNNWLGESASPPTTPTTPENRDRYATLLKGDHNSSAVSISSINTPERTIDHGRTMVDSEPIGTSTNGSSVNSYVHESPGQSQVPTGPMGTSTSNTNWNVESYTEESIQAYRITRSELHTHTSTTQTTSTSAISTSQSSCTGGKAITTLQVGDSGGDSELENSTRYIWCLDSSLPKVSNDEQADDVTSTIKDKIFEGEFRGETEVLSDTESGKVNTDREIKKGSIVITERPAVYNEVVLTLSKNELQKISDADQSKPYESDYPTVDTGNLVTDQHGNKLNERGLSGSGLSLNISENKQDHGRVETSPNSVPISATGGSGHKTLNIGEPGYPSVDPYTKVGDERLGTQARGEGDRRDFDQALGKVLTDMKSRCDANTGKIRPISERAGGTREDPGNIGMPLHNTATPQSMPQRMVCQHDDPAIQSHLQNAGRTEGSITNTRLYDSGQHNRLNEYTTATAVTQQQGVDHGSRAKPFITAQPQTGVTRDQHQYHIAVSGGSQIPTGIFYIPRDQQVSRQGTDFRPTEHNGSVLTNRPRGEPGGVPVQLLPGQVNNQHTGRAGNMGNQQDGGIYYANEIHIDPDGEYGFHPMHYERETFKDKYDSYYSNDEATQSVEGGYDSQMPSKRYGIPYQEFPTNATKERSVYSQNENYRETHFQDRQQEPTKPDYMHDRGVDGGDQPQVKYAAIKKTNDPVGSISGPPLSPRSLSGSWGQHDPHAYLDRSYQDLGEGLHAGGYHGIDPAMHRDTHHDYASAPSRQGYKGDKQAPAPTHMDYSRNQIFAPYQHQDASIVVDKQQGYTRYGQVNRPQDIRLIDRSSWSGSDGSLGPVKSPPWRSDRSPSRSPRPQASSAPPPPGKRSSSLVLPGSYQTDPNARSDSHPQYPHLLSYDDYDHGPLSPRSCTALATSTALARKDTGRHDDGRISPGDASKSVISAIGNAEATGENPYIAVARATARAATIASAHAAAGVANMPPSASDESGSDINVVISTSCTIKNEQSPRLEDDSRDVIKVMDSNQPRGEFQNRPLNYNQRGALPDRSAPLHVSGAGNIEVQKKMLITIEQQGTQEKRSRTVECELPLDTNDDDISKVISGAVKRILNSEAASNIPYRDDKQLNDIIERVTQQVVRAYITEHDNSGGGDSKHTERMENSAKYQYRDDISPTVRRISPVTSETVPAFRAPRIDRETYRQMHKVHKKDEEDADLAKYAVPVNTFGQRLQYVAPPRGRSVTPERSRQPDVNQSKSKEDQTYFYVTGTGPGERSTGRQQGEVVLKVMKDNNLQPTVEHVSLSETESGSEAGTPMATRKSQGPASAAMAQERLGGQRQITYRDERISSRGQRGASLDRAISRNETPNESVSSPRKIKGILRTSPRVEQQRMEGGQYSGMDTNFRAISPHRHSTDTAPAPRYGKKPIYDKEVEKKPYSSVLLRPVQDKPTPLSVAKRFEDQEKPVSEKRSKLDDARKGYLDLVPKNPPWPKQTVLDAAFEEKKKKWFQKSAAKDGSSTGGFMVVDINIDQESYDDKKSKSKSSEDLKRRLSAARPKAPNSSEIDQRWQSLAKIKPYKSHGNLLDEETLGASPHEIRKQGTEAPTSAADLRRVKSLGTLPSQFFANKRSYTSLLETDLDTGVCTETPLVYETDLDGVRPSKARSLTNLSMKTSMVPIDIDEARRKSFETLPREGSGLIYSLPQDNDSENSSFETSQERSLSAGELRITQSLNKLSIPNWYRQSFGKGKKPVELTHTRQLREGSLGGDSPDSSFESHRREENMAFVGIKADYQYQPPKPVVIQHRVSNTMRAKSPVPISPSATSEKQGNFELPSSKLKTQHVKLKPVEIKPVQRPPIQVPKKNSAKEAYLRLKAQSRVQQDVLSQASRDKQTPGNGRDVNGTKDDRFTTTSFITLTPRSIPGEKPRTYSSGRESGLGPTSSYQRDAPHKNSQQGSSVRRYEPGATCSGLVDDMHLGDGADSDQYNPANAVYATMLDNIETQRKEIQERAYIITTDKSVPPGLVKWNESECRDKRKGFPVLSYDDSPSSRARKSENADKRASNVELSARKNDSSVRSPRLTAPRNGVPTKDPSLDSILGGLLAIPSTSDPTSPSSEEEEINSSPKTRVFRLLKNATTPRGSMTSVKTSKTQENVSDPEDNIDSSPTDQAYDNIDPEFALNLYPKQQEKCTEEAAIVRCRNPKCKKATSLPEARNTYKTCHNCFTYYCGRECRKAHWERHKRKCLFSRVNSVCKHIVKKVHDTPDLLETISKVARTGYLSKGRGCVLIAFTSPEKADLFLTEGAQALETPPGYANLGDLKEASDIFGEHYFELVDMCKIYNPEIKFVIEVAVVSGQEVPAWPVPRREGPAIKKCAKLRLSTAPSKSTPSRGEPETLILTAVPGSEFTENMEEKKAREICFVNIQRKLRQRGVSLRHHFPDVYNKLCAYVSDNAHFTPMTIYPIDANTGKRFMCVIMPNSEPEVEWMHSPDLLDELGLATQV